MRRILNFIISHIKSNEVNKGLFATCVIAFLISISYQITFTWPELFPGADRLYNYFSNFSFAYICSYTFFLVSVFVPSIIKEIKTYEIVSVYIEEILKDWQNIMDKISASTEIEYDKSNADLEQFIKMEKNLNLNFELKDKIKSIENIDGKLKFTHQILLEFINERIEAISIKVDIIERYTEVDPNLLVILNNLRTNTFVKMNSVISDKIMMPIKNPIEGIGKTLYKCNLEIVRLEKEHQNLENKYKEQFWYKP